jgi:hypothetical protein
MAISMNLWRIGKDKTLQSALKSKLNFENELETWICQDPTILDLDLMVLGRQVHTDHGGYIDILGLNKDGDLVIIELKRNKTPRDVIAQCLDYASWVNDLSYEQIVDLYEKSTGKSLQDAYQDFFDDPLPESLNENHQIVIVAASLDDATERIIQFLADKHSVNINAVFFNTFEIEGNQILGRSWLKDPEIIEEKTTGKRAPWTGFLFVNTGINHGRPRDWEMNKQFSFVSAGGGNRWMKAIKKLNPGDKIFAYIKGEGYVGHGVVKEEAVPVSEYECEGKKIIDSLPNDHPWKHPPLNIENQEWLSKVEWIKTFSKDKARWIINGFANQNVVCKLRDKRTFDFLAREFGIDPEFLN